MKLALLRKELRMLGKNDLLPVANRSQACRLNTQEHWRCFDKDCVCDCHSAEHWGMAGMYGGFVD